MANLADLPNVLNFVAPTRDAQHTHLITTRARRSLSNCRLRTAYVEYSDCGGSATGSKCCTVTVCRRTVAAFGQIAEEGCAHCESEWRRRTSGPTHGWARTAL